VNFKELRKWSNFASAACGRTRVDTKDPTIPIPKRRIDEMSAGQAEKYLQPGNVCDIDSKQLQPIVQREP
jgi:hypothetical protein